ncbi:hypothetical protein ACIPSA_30920 [Streptomyces sp. NPDC086549]|uniref:hypothetical protein n=1 Tax=Streptomyces sp. NPDC086549 TaxID=3365752 RepID=UPI0037FAD55C
MAVIPGWVWRRNTVGRALSIGLPTGLFAGAFALVESRAWPSAVVVFLALSAVYGPVMARRMGRAWPGAEELHAADRAAVVRATRRGEDIGDARLAPAVLAYADALRAARERGGWVRWVVLLAAVVAVVLALHDTLNGSTGEAVSSWTVVALFVADLTWRPRREAHLIARAEQAEQSARRLLPRERPVD